MKVIIADDHPIFRSGLAFLLESSFDKVDLLSFENGSEVLPNIPLFQPDIILLDIDMPLKNGLDCCAEIKNAYPESKVIILSIHKSNEMVKLAFFNGASGYLIKDNTSEEIVECIQFVLGGKKFLPKVLRTLSEDKNVDVEMSQLEKILFTLTATELKVLKLVSQKYSSKEIANLLFVSPKSVENYRSRISKKLNLDHKNNSLLLWAIEHHSLVNSEKFK